MPAGFIRRRLHPAVTQANSEHMSVSKIAGRARTPSPTLPRPSALKKTRRRPQSSRRSRPARGTALAKLADLAGVNEAAGERSSSDCASERCTISVVASRRSPPGSRHVAAQRPHRARVNGAARQPRRLHATGLPRADLLLVHSNLLLRRRSSLPSSLRVVLSPVAYSRRDPTTLRDEMRTNGSKTFASPLRKEAKASEPIERR